MGRTHAASSLQCSSVLTAGSGCGATADIEDVSHPYEGAFKNTQNATLKNTNNTEPSPAENDDPTDLGVLATPVQTPSALANDAVREPESADQSPTVCMIGYYGDYGTNTPPEPAAAYLKDHVSSNAPEGFGIVFDEKSQTVFCNQHYDVDAGDYSCAFLTFRNCNVKCNGKQSCFNALIEDAPDRIECDGYQSCYGAHLDIAAGAGGSIDCGEEQSCRAALIGAHADQPIATLDCHEESACQAAKVYSVDEVFCTGNLACYEAQISGVTSKVICQSLPHPEGYFYPTCGGENAFIEAAEDLPSNGIEVMCRGDFSCIGYGHDAYDHKEHPIYFDIDVGGKHGELICEGSFVQGNVNGGEYVCRYIDIIQGCQNYECHEPLGFNEENDYRTCNHIFSVHHHELCYEGPRDSDFENENENDDDDDDDDNTDGLDNIEDNDDNGNDDGEDEDEDESDNDDDDDRDRDDEVDDTDNEKVIETATA